MPDAPLEAARPTRNLVVCCDGTGNVWGNLRDTNVVRLVRACVKDAAQIVYYDPGVGTASQYPSIGPIESLKIWSARLWGLAFGGGIYDDIGSAYAFLIRHYRPGDRIWVFGFSRGAFTARAVAGMVNLFGVVRPAGEVMIPTLLRIYFSNRERRNAQDRSRDDLAADIRRNFTDPAGHAAWVYFTGVWDTVASVGGLRPVQISSPLSSAGKHYDHIRHAVSAAEYRAPYEARTFPDDENREQPGQVTTGAGQTEYRPGLKQLYFPGVHSDVGGSYPERGLSDCSLAWMLAEAQDKGLRLLPGWADTLHPDPLGQAHDQPTNGWFGCLWALAGLRRRPPEPAHLRHASLTQRLAAQLGDGAPQVPLWRQRPFQLGLVLVGALLALRDWHPVFGLGLIAACLYLGCGVSAYSVRRLRDWRAHSCRTHRWLGRWAQVPLWVAPLAGLLEHALTWTFSGHAGWLLGATCGLKWAAVASLVALLMWSLAAGRRS